MIEEILLKNKTINKQIRINKTTTENYVLDTVDLGVIQSTNNTVQYIDQIGVSILKKILGTRNISIEAWIIGSEKQITERKKLINEFCNPLQDMELVYKDYRLEFTCTTTVSYGVTEETNNYAMAKFKIDGFCADPLFYGLKEQHFNLQTVRGMFHFPLIFNPNMEPPGVTFGILGENNIISVQNEGSLESGMRINLKAMGNGFTNFCITNVRTEEFFKINKAVEFGEEIEINTEIGNRFLRGRLGDENLNYFRYKDFASSWLQLSEGDNLFRIECDDGFENLDIDIFFNNRYLEVQECI